MDIAVEYLFDYLDFSTYKKLVKLINTLPHQGGTF